MCKTCLSVGGPRSSVQAVVALSDYLSRYIHRKVAFLPDHPRNSPRRARRLLDQVGQPDQGLSIILLVGTKGKGSTAAMLESILRMAGYRTGLYLSPHLHSPRERVRVQAKIISRPAFASSLWRMYGLLEDSLSWDDWGPATLFEGLTVVALAHFAQYGVEVAVVEAGMGGRMDATHALVPFLTLLTPIALDHQAYLGDTLETIALEKAGAILPGALALSVPQRGEAQLVLDAHCRRVGAELRLVGDADVPDLGLLGPHQVFNARLALGAVATLREQGWGITDVAVREGLRWVHLPGRMEVVARRPLTLVDSAHNPAATRALALALEGQQPPGSSVHFVMGCSGDKDLPAMISSLKPLAAGVVATRAQHHRAIDPRHLAELWEAQGVPVEVVPDVGAALHRGRDWAGPSGRLCVTGSFFVVAEAREALGLAVREPWPEPVVPSIS
jgi:dihydrofolate synthase/folylpolyglutamate synthase